MDYGGFFSPEKLVFYQKRTAKNHNQSYPSIRWSVSTHLEDLLAYY
jgi:hypothetical protein